MKVFYNRKNICIEIPTGNNMKTGYKINKLIKLENKSELTSRQLKEIIKLSSDQEPFIRS